MDEWIDAKTRAVFADVNVYNANVNLLTMVKIVFEFPSFGGIKVTPYVESFRPYPYVNSWDFVVLLIQLMFLLLPLINIIRAAVRLIRLRTQYLRDVWNLVELLHIVLACLCVAMFVCRTITVISAVEDVHNYKG